MHMTFAPQQSQEKPLAFVVIPPLLEEVDMAAVEAVMQSLVLDEAHPVALELAGTRRESPLHCAGHNHDRARSCRGPAAVPLSPDRDPFSSRLRRPAPSGSA